MYSYISQIELPYIIMYSYVLQIELPYMYKNDLFVCIKCHFMRKRHGQETAIRLHIYMDIHKVTRLLYVRVLVHNCICTSHIDVQCCTCTRTRMSGRTCTYPY